MHYKWLRLSSKLPILEVRSYSDVSDRPLVFNAKTPAYCVTDKIFNSLVIQQLIQSGKLMEVDPIRPPPPAIPIQVDVPPPPPAPIPELPAPPSEELTEPVVSIEEPVLSTEDITVPDIGVPKNRKRRQL